MHVSTATPLPRPPAAKLYVSIWAAMTALSFIPFLVTPLPPLNDYPSHLARAYIISAIQDSPELQQFYSIDWQLVPNLAVDLLVPALASVIPIELAMIVFTLMSIVLVSSGTVAVNAALFGRPSIAALGAMLILFNRQLLWGFVGYFFTLGVALWVFAFWVQSGEKRREAGRTLLFAIAAFLLFVGHFHAFATYAVVVAGYEISLLRGTHLSIGARLRALSAGAIQFLPSLVAFLLFSPTRNRAAEIEYASMIAKLTGIFDAFHAYDVRLDAFTIVAVAALAVIGLATRTLVVHRLLLLPIITLAIIYLVMPTTMLGSFAADRRLATSLYFLLAASTCWRFSGSRAATVALSLLAGLFFVRTAVVVRHWSEAGRTYSDLLNVLDQLPVGTRLAGAVAKPVSSFLEDPPVMYFASMAVVRRQAFVNTLFAEKGHQPLRLSYQPADVKSSRLPHVFFVADGRAGDPFDRIRTTEYDYFLLLNTRYFPAEKHRGLLTVAERPGLYSFNRNAAVTASGPAVSSGSVAVPAR